MEGIDRVYEVEGIIFERQFRAVADFEERPNFLFRIFHAVGRDIQPRDLDARHGLGEFVQKENFSTADIENAVACFQAVVRGHFLGNRQPAAVIMPAPIAELPLAIPRIEAPLFGHFGTGRLVMLGNAADIVAGRTVVKFRYEVEVRHLLSRLFTRTAHDRGKRGDVQGRYIH